MSGPVTQCQSCASRDLESVLFLGFQPLANSYKKIGEPAQAETNYPLELLRCTKCELVQLGYVVPAELLFPADYPYTSGSTEALRLNFSDLREHVKKTIDLAGHDLAIDIGSNDGTLLTHLEHRRVLGVTPENVRAPSWVPTERMFFSGSAAVDLLGRHGPAKLITTTNCFAHVPDPHDFLEGVKTLLAPGGVFVVEVQYLYDTLEKNYFDCVYHEHLRYYTLRSLSVLLAPHGLEPFRVQRVPTHGGSIRVWVCRGGELAEEQSIQDLQNAECSNPVDAAHFDAFWERLGRNYADFAAAMADRKVFGIGAPSRAGVLLHFYGLDHRFLPVVFEAPGSQRVGKYMPGTRIMVAEEFDSLSDMPGDALILSHHIADELIPKLRAKGFRGKFIVPLPEVKVIDA